LRMLKDVVITKNDPQTKSFQFSVFYTGEQLAFRASSSDELHSWVKMIKLAVQMARPLNLGLGSTMQRNSPKKSRESKILDANDLIAHRPRLSSARSNVYSQSMVDTPPVTPLSASVPEVDEYEQKEASQ